MLGRAVGQRHGGFRRKRRVFHHDWNCGERLNGIDPAGAQQRESGAIFFRELEKVHGAVKIMLEELATARAAIYAGQHARICGRVDDPVDFANRLEVAGATKIGVSNDDTTFTKQLDIKWAARAAEIIEGDYLTARDVIEQPVSERAADKTASARDENLHRRKTGFISIRLNKQAEVFFHRVILTEKLARTISHDF